LKKKVIFFTGLFLVILLTLSPVFAETSAAILYTVKQGDTIWRIAQNHGVTMDALLTNNPELRDERNLKAGMVLVIPDNSSDLIPVDTTITETQTLIVHGSGNNALPVFKHDNVMIVGGKKVQVPEHATQIAANTGADKADYKSKYHNRSSRAVILGNNIINTAFKFQGVPYVYGGSTPRGFDCSGYVQYVYNLHGVKTPRMAHHQYYAGTPVSRANLIPGDLVFFETYTAGISHVGIYIGNNKFIHASSSGAVRINGLDQEYYRTRYRGAARYY
jgi:cell wall-associated NlpC family hydrolase